MTSKNLLNQKNLIQFIESKTGRRTEPFAVTYQQLLDAVNKRLSDHDAACSAAEQALNTADVMSADPSSIAKLKADLARLSAVNLLDDFILIVASDVDGDDWGISTSPLFTVRSFLATNLSTSAAASLIV